MIEAAEFADLALLDGHYLRRSDAEIFGEPGAEARMTAHEQRLRIRRMELADLDSVMEIAAGTKNAPNWTREAYLRPRSEQGFAEAVGAGRNIPDLAGFAAATYHPEAELETIVTAVPFQRRGIAGRAFVMN